VSLTIYPRAAWGARYGDGDANAPVPAAELWLHHSVTSAPPVGATFEQDAVAVRTLEQIGQSRFGFGISYTFVVAPSGRVFVGHSVHRRGAHTGGRNSISRAICLIGNYETAVPSPQMQAVVSALVAHGAAAGWWDRPALDGGHRDAPGASTACPGVHAWRLIPQLNANALQEDDMFTDADRAKLDTLARRVDVGFMRDQLMTHLGKNPGAAPLPPAEWHGVEAARRVDVGHALEQILARLDAIEAKLDEGAPEGGTGGGEVVGRNRG
jgi:N-acetylmuramoyl-L-alanine amidase